MAASLVHAFVSGKSNGSDGTLVQPSNWNAAHVLSGATQGDLIVAATSTTTGSIAAVAVGQVLVSAGTGTVPAWSATPTLTSVTTTSQFVGAGGSKTVPTYTFVGNTNYGLYTAGGALKFTASGADIVQFSATSFLINDPTPLGWGSIGFDNGDTFLSRVAAGVVGITSDGTSDNSADLGSSSVRVRSGYFGTSLAVGTNPAASGALRFAQNTQIKGRNNANNADYNLIDWGASFADWMVVGDGSANGVIFGGQILAFATNTNAAPALLRSGTTLEVRLADNSGFTTLQANIQFGANRTAASVPGNFAANYYMLLTDAAGNNFYVPAMNASW